MMEKERIVYLDILRVLACSMIVLMHSPHPEAGVPGYVQVPLGFMTGAGIGLFFMVSGALLLPVKTDTFSFLRHRIGKILWPLLFWTLFYMAVKYVSGDLDSEHLVNSLVSIPFSAQGHGVLWFMYTLAGLYLLAPIVSPMLQRASERELRFYLFLWGVTLCYPWLRMIVGVNDTSTGILYYFTGYAGYFLLGYYLHTYHTAAPTWLLPFLIIIPLGCLLCYKGFGGNGSMYDLFWYLSIFVALMSFGWFEIIRRLNPLTKIGGGGNLLIFSSNCSFGIYLVHIFVMRYILWNVDFIVYGLGWVGQMIMTWTLTFLISFALTYAISLLPFGDYIVGFRTKRK